MVIQLLAFAINSYKIDLNIRAVGLENTCETYIGLAGWWNYCSAVRGAILADVPCR